MNGKLVNLSIFLLSAMLILPSCLREDPIILTDGIYIKGKSTAFNDFDENGLMKPAINEVDGQLRTGLYEIFIPISTESEGFKIIDVVNNVQTKNGPSSHDNIILNGENGQINGTIQKGIFGPGAGVFTVPENGIYHVIIDKQTSTYVISPVSDISLYGQVTAEEWSDTEIPMSSGFDKSTMMFEITGLDLMEGEFRFRYGHGDKIEISGNEVKVFTSFGGLLSGTLPAFELSMGPGGNNYSLVKEQEGTYTLDVNWTIGEGFTAQMTETGSSDYPEKLFMIGDGISSLSGEDAWNWDLNNFEMIPAYSKPHLFWKIVWLNNNGGIRFASQRGSENDFGKDGEIVNEVYSIGEQNVPVPGSAGYYMVVVNLYTEQISITMPAVYLIGDAVGSWDPLNTNGRFSIDNSYQILYLMKYLATGNNRMYAWHDKGWFTNWWNAEFTINNGDIIYRGNGPNPESFYLNEGGYNIKLNFRTGEALVEKCSCSG